MSSLLSSVQQSIWDALEASTDFTNAFPDTARLKSSDFTAQTRIDAIGSDYDMPNIRVFPISQNADAFKDGQVTFGMKNNWASCKEAVCETRLSFNMGITHASLTYGNDGDIDDLLEICFAALLAKGPSLGNAAVNRWSFESINHRTMRPDQSDIVALVADVRLNVDTVVSSKYYLGV